MSGSDDEIHILLVDDEPEFAEAAARFLEREQERFAVELARDVEEAERRLEIEKFDCIVSDYEMPGRDGVEFLETVRGRDPDLPFILFTGKGSEEVASVAVSAGVTDYLQKEVGVGQYALLANRIDNAVSARRSDRRRAETEKRLADQNRALRRLYEISAERGGSFEQKVREILDLGREYLGMQAGMLTRIDRGEQRWEVVEISQPAEEVPVGTVAPLSETYCRKAIEADGVFALEDAPAEGWAEDPAYERWGHRTYIGSGVWIDDACYGTLCFVDSNRRERPFDEAQCRFVDLASHGVSSELERRHYARELERHSDYTDDLLDAIEDVFYVVGRDGYPRRWNASLSEVTGYSDDEIAEMHVTEFFADGDRQRVAAAVEEVFETGQTMLEARAEMKSGECRPFEHYGVRLVDPDGEPILVGTGRDVTERKCREGALERERDRLDSLFEHLPNPVAHGTLEGSDAFILAVNPAFERTFGHGAEEVEGKRLHDIVLPDEEAAARRAEKLVHHLQEHGKLHTEVQRKAADGLRDFRLDVTVDTQADPPEGFAIYTDITERKERERRRERRFEAIFDHTYQYTGLLEPDGTLIEANRAALEMGGLDDEEVVGKPFWETPWWQVDDMAPERAREAVERAADGEFVRFETEHRTKGENIVVDFSIRPVTDDDGEVIYLLPEGRNITEMKALQEREEALERQNERLDEFASVVSHDLRNPLNSAVTHLELARRERDSDDLEAVARAHERMKVLIEDVLSLAREGKTVTSPEPVDLGELFEVVVYDLETGEAKLGCEAEREVWADERRLRRLLENLLLNAVEHGGEGVEVRLGEFDEGFYVEDDGPGIPEQDREKILEPGYSTSDEGTGFGLSIAREIAEAHEWRLRVGESAEGGARFEFWGVEIVREDE